MAYTFLSFYVKYNAENTKNKRNKLAYKDEDMVTCDVFAVIKGY